MMTIRVYLLSCTKTDEIEKFNIHEDFLPLLLNSVRLSRLSKLRSWSSIFCKVFFTKANDSYSLIFKREDTILGWIGMKSNVTEKSNFHEVNVCSTWLISFIELFLLASFSSPLVMKPSLI